MLYECRDCNCIFEPDYRKELTCPQCGAQDTAISKHREPTLSAADFIKSERLVVGEDGSLLGDDGSSDQVGIGSSSKRMFVFDLSAPPPLPEMKIIDGMPAFFMGDRSPSNVLVKLE